MAKVSIPEQMHVSIRIALGLIVGVVLASASPWLLSPIGCAAGILLCLLRLRPTPHRTALIAVLMGIAALNLSDMSQSGTEARHAHELDDREGELLIGTVEGMPLQWPGRQQLRLRTSTARIWLTVYGDPASRPVVLEPGQRLEVFARLQRPHGLRGEGAADRRRMVMAQGADLIARASSEDLTLLEEHWSWWLVPVRMHRWAVDRIFEGDGSPDGRAIVAALATGDRGHMHEELSRAVRATGVAHLLAVSGMHLAAVVALVFFFVLRLWPLVPWHQCIEPRAVAAALALACALGFTAITGARPSTCRALLVATFVLLGMILDRRMRLLHALAWSASVLLLWRPVLLWDVGFQLSFAATTALALAFRDEHRLHFESRRLSARALRSLHALGRASFWATLATAPISLYHFGEVSWLALLSNLVAVPFTTLLLLPLALFGLALSSFWVGAGAPLLELAVRLSQGLANVCYGVEAYLPLQLRAPLSILELLTWGLVVIALLGRWSWFSRRQRVLAILSATALLLLSRNFAAPLAAARSDSLRVTFVEIGQGDAAVIEVPGGEVWLVDGGGLPFVGETAGKARQRVAETPARQALLPYLRHRRIDHIDLVVVSHPHPDHYVGLQAVARAMPIDELWSAHRASARPGPYEVWLQELERAGTRIVAPRLGSARSRDGAVLEVLWPRYAEPGLRARRAQSDPILSVNDNSLVLRLDFAGRRVLFTGDIEQEAEELLVAELSEELRADVVKVPHHGSGTSSTADFVSATRPGLALISCGRANHFGFPDDKVEARWLEHASYLLRTDQVGSVTLEVSPEGEMQVDTASAF